MSYNPISGLSGKRAVTINEVLPQCGGPSNNERTNRSVLNPHGWAKPLPLANGTDLVNRGGAYGVMPCGMAWNYMDVLRRPSGNKMTGLYPQMGFARGQPKGLAYNPQKPLNLPIMKQTSSINAALVSKV